MTEPVRTSDDICREKCPERKTERAFIVTTRDAAWIALLLLVAGGLIGRWL